MQKNSGALWAIRTVALALTPLVASCSLGESVDQGEGTAAKSSPRVAKGANGGQQPADDARLSSDSANKENLGSKTGNDATPSDPGKGNADSGNLGTGNPDSSDPGTSDAGVRDASPPDSASNDATSSSDQALPPDARPQGLIFFDDFEYAVSRESQAGVDGTNNAFVTEGGWGWVKSVQFGRAGAKGYLYTTGDIPGAAQALPGRGSQRVLALEARPRSMYNPSDPGSVPQTDFYLQFGNPEGGPADAVPGNVWFQFWLYVNHYDDPTDQNDQLSLFDGGFKMIYPCNRHYPCTAGNLNWLYSMESGDIMLPEGTRPAGPTSHLFMRTVGTGAVYSAVPEWNVWKLGQNANSTPIRANQWTLVKLHFDTSTASASYEAWIKPAGSDWIKVSDWHDASTVDFSWVFEQPGGHRGFRMPTTMGHGSASRVDRAHDTWMYLDDFAMAADEVSLPAYP